MGLPDPEERLGGDQDDPADGAEGSESTSPSTPEVPEVLRDGSPRKILERLTTGDPLEMWPRTRERIEALAFLVDPSRVELRSLARVAYSAAGYRGVPPLAEWLSDLIDRAIGEVANEDREAERDGLPLAETSEAAFRFVSQLLGIEPQLARRATVAFNSLPAEVRSAWFAVAVLGKSVHRYVAEGHGPPEVVRAQMKLALETIDRAIGRHGGPHESQGGGAGD
jgi:hypothetical protein